MGIMKKIEMLETYGFALWIYPLMIILVILFSICTEWDPNTGIDTITTTTTNSGHSVYIRTPKGTSMDSPIMTYAMYMDATAMCAMGFGFLYVFSKYYIWGGVGMNFFICGFCFLWVTVCNCFITSAFEGHFVRTQINLETMVNNNYVTAAVLISFGAFYGFISPTQLLIICIIEPFMMMLSEHIVFHLLHVQDAGGSIVTHAFGAYYGIAVVFAMGVKVKHIPTKHRRTTYFSDMGAMIGTIILWIFWPSFNGALLYNDITLQGRVVTNTYLAICSSCVTAFATTTLIHRGKMEMMEIQNATLAGGVIIGMISSFLIDPWVSVLIGGIGGVLSTMGYGLLHPFLEGCGITDSAAVQMLHGIPGILGGIFAALATLADNTNYMYSYDTQWTTSDDCDRSRGQQFGYIIGSILCVLGIAIASGLITGMMIKLPCLPSVENDDMLLDHDFWHIHDREHDPRAIKTGTTFANKRAGRASTVAKPNPAALKYKP